MVQLTENAESVRCPETPVEYYPCFTPEQWRDYRTAAREAIKASNGYQPAGPCTDCLPEFQARKVREGRCIRPDTVFAVQWRCREPADRGIEGRWPTEAA